MPELPDIAVYTERLADKVQAWDDGEWVRDAALAYARKQSQPVQEAA
jgi:ring-1,2-phenylacetyl-CoA epoxidase subunit PaaA